MKILTILLFSLLFHPVHVTMSSLTIMEGGKGYEMVLRVYSDDLAMDIWRLYQPDESFFADHRYIGPDSYLEKYVNDNVLIKVNGKVIGAVLGDVETTELETIMRLEVPLKRNPKSLSIDNRILTDIYPDQVNLFIYKDNETEKAFRFTVDKYSGALLPGN